MTLVRYARRFIDILGADFPGTLSEVRRLIRADVWRIAIGAESVLISSREGALAVDADGGRKADAQCAITLGALRALMRSELTVVRSLATEELDCRGAPRSLLRLSEALHLVFDSIPRSRGLEKLASRFWKAHGMDGNGPVARRPRQGALQGSYRFGLIPILENQTMEGYDG